MESWLKVADQKNLFEGAVLLREELEIAILKNLTDKFWFIVDEYRSSHYYTNFQRKQEFGDTIKEMVVFDFLGKKIYTGENLSLDLSQASYGFVEVVLRGFQLIMKDDPMAAQKKSTVHDPVNAPLPMDLDSLLKYSEITKNLAGLTFIKENSLFQEELAEIQTGIQRRIQVNKKIPKENLLDFSRYLLANCSEFTTPMLTRNLKIFFANYTSRCYAMTNSEIAEITSNLARIDPSKKFYQHWLNIMGNYVFSDTSRLVQKEYEFIHNKMDHSERLKKIKEVNENISVFLKLQKDMFAKNPNLNTGMSTDSDNILVSYRSLLNVHGKLKTVYKWSDNYDDYFYYKLQTIAISNFYTMIMALDSHFMLLVDGQDMTVAQKSLFLRKSLDDIFNSLMVIGFKMILKNYLRPKYLTIENLAR